jgi:cysteine desulfurase/selenocysteine lyase
MRKDDFPIFKKHPDLVYLDTAATAQRAGSVITAMHDFMAQANAPIHRGLYPLAVDATEAYESVRSAAASFIGAENPKEIVFTRNTTESMNLFAHSWGRSNLQAGDEVMVTRMEHHANFVPWLGIAKETGAKLVIVELTEEGRIDMEDFAAKLTPKTKLVGVVHVSNVLGTINPVAEIGAMLKEHPALFLVDAAQSAAHLPLSVAEFNCDVLLFSGHKLYGPTGAGVLWAKMELLEAMPPFMTGGHMINEVHDDTATWSGVPQKFEAGSPDSISIVGLGAAIAYMESVGLDAIVAHEEALIRTALKRFSALSPVRVLGPGAEGRSGVVAFVVDGVHPHDVGSILGDAGIGVRAGHHCAQPLHRKLGIPASARISFGVYTEPSDLEKFFDALETKVLPLAT